MNSIETAFAEYANVFGILEIISLAFLMAIVSETVWDFITGARKKLGETFANYVIQIVNTLLERTVFGLAFVLGLVLVSPFALFTIEHTWWSWILAILVADFFYYWMHRLEHEIRIFWAHHSVHHSSPEFNLTTALRLSWVEGAIEWIFFVPMILLGFDVVQTVIAIAGIVLYQTWLHTEKIGKLGFLDKIFNTPSVHRVHHGSNAQYIDKNYGGLLIIWDRMFGTYETEGEKVIYGITEPLETSNPITINFKEYLDIFRDIQKSKSLGVAIGHFFGRPGWKPEQPGQSERAKE